MIYIKTIIIIFSLLPLIIQLTGCTQISISDNNKQFIGTWISTDSFSFTNSFTCFSDGTFTSELGAATWEIKEKKFVITGKDGAIVFNYELLNNDTKLILNPLSGTGVHNIENQSYVFEKYGTKK